MSRNRNPSIELFRIIMMLGICMIHVCAQGANGRQNGFTSLLCSSVVGFVFISGFFGVKFKVSKIIALYALCLLYCCLVPLIGGVIGGGGYVDAVLKTFCAEKRFWFLHAYAILIMLSPVINRALNKERGVDMSPLALSVPLLFVVFIWGWGTHFPSTASFIPRPYGLASHGVLTMIGIYVAARLFSVYALIDKLSFRVMALGIIVSSGAIISLGTRCAPYNCPIAFVLICFVFCAFSKIRVGNRLAKLILIISPSMFGVYLLHTIIYIPGIDSEQYGLINAVRDFLMAKGYNWYLSCFMTAIGVFVISLIIDLIRRYAMLKIFARPKQLICEGCDKVYHLFENKLRILVGETVDGCR